MTIDATTLRRRLLGLLDPHRLGWAEAAALLALLGVAVGLWLFAALTDEVLEGDTHAFDESVLLALRTPGDTDNPIGPAWLEYTMRDLTALGGYPLLGLIAAVAVGYLLLARVWASALLVPFVLLGGTLLNHALKTGFDRTRPSLVAHVVEVQTLSYPSGHAMLSAILYLTLGVMVAETQAARRARVYVMAVALALTLITGISRVYLGVHWPTDVLAGWSVGAAFALGIWLCPRWGPGLWRRRRSLLSRPGAGPARRPDPPPDPSSRPRA